MTWLEKRTRETRARAIRSHGKERNVFIPATTGVCSLVSESAGGANANKKNTQTRAHTSRVTRRETERKRERRQREGGNAADVFLTVLPISRASYGLYPMLAAVLASCRLASSTMRLVSALSESSNWFSTVCLQ